MSLKIIVVVMFAASAIARHVPDLHELDEDDEILFRAAYDTPSYNQYEYQYEEDDSSVGKLDLLKDGMFAIKAKIMEMKAINKALAANMLSTKLKLKELLANKLKVLKPLKKHHHVEVEHKPSYSYQTPASPPPQPSYPQHIAPQYNAPKYNAPQYNAPNYNAPHYNAPHYEAQEYAPPAYVHDPYYGH